MLVNLLAYGKICTSIVTTLSWLYILYYIIASNIFKRSEICFWFWHACCNKKMTDLKEEILAKIDEKFNEIKIDFLTEIKEQIKIK